MATTTGTPPEGNFGSRQQLRGQYVYLMVYLLTCVGLRPSEILDLNSRSVDLEKQIVTIPSRKNRRTREVNIPSREFEMLLAYLLEPNHARWAAMNRVAGRLRRHRKK